MALVNSVCKGCSARLPAVAGHPRRLPAAARCWLPVQPVQPVVPPPAPPACQGPGIVRRISIPATPCKPATRPALLQRESSMSSPRLHRPSRPAGARPPAGAAQRGGAGGAARLGGAAAHGWAGGAQVGADHGALHFGCQVGGSASRRAASCGGCLVATKGPGVWTARRGMPDAPCGLMGDAFTRCFACRQSCRQSSAA